MPPVCFVANAPRNDVGEVMPRCRASGFLQKLSPQDKALYLFRITFDLGRNASEANVFDECSALQRDGCALDLEILDEGHAIAIIQNRSIAVACGLFAHRLPFAKNPPRLRKRATRRPPFASCLARDKSARIEFDNQVRFHDDRIGNVCRERHAGHLGRHLGMIDFVIIRHVTLWQANGFEQNEELA